MPSRFKPSSKRQHTETEPVVETNTTQPKQSKGSSKTLQHKPVKSTPDGSNPADDTPIDESISSAKWGVAASTWLVPGQLYDISGVHRNHSGQNAYCSFWGYEFVKTESVKRLRDGVETMHYRYVFRYPNGQTLNVYDDDIHEYTSFRKASTTGFKPDEDYEAYKLWVTGQPRTTLLSKDDDADTDVVETVKQETDTDQEGTPPKRKFKRRF